MNFNNRDVAGLMMVSHTRLMDGRTAGGRLDIRRTSGHQEDVWTSGGCLDIRRTLG